MASRYQEKEELSDKFQYEIIFHKLDMTYAPKYSVLSLTFKAELQKVDIKKIKQNLKRLFSNELTFITKNRLKYYYQFAKYLKLLTNKHKEHFKQILMFYSQIYIQLKKVQINKNQKENLHLMIKQNKQLQMKHLHLNLPFYQIKIKAHMVINMQTIKIILIFNSWKILQTLIRYNFQSKNIVLSFISNLELRFLLIIGKEKKVPLLEDQELIQQTIQITKFMLNMNKMSHQKNAMILQPEQHFKLNVPKQKHQTSYSPIQGSTTQQKYNGGTGAIQPQQQQQQQQQLTYKSFAYKRHQDISPFQNKGKQEENELISQKEGIFSSNNEVSGQQVSFQTPVQAKTAANIKKSQIITINKDKKVENKKSQIINEKKTPNNQVQNNNTINQNDMSMKNSNLMTSYLTSSIETTHSFSDAKDKLNFKQNSLRSSVTSQKSKNLQQLPQSKSPEQSSKLTKNTLLTPRTKTPTPTPNPISVTSQTSVSSTKNSSKNEIGYREKSAEQQEYKSQYSHRSEKNNNQQKQQVPKQQQQIVEGRKLGEERQKVKEIKNADLAEKLQLLTQKIRNESQDPRERGRQNMNDSSNFGKNANLEDNLNNRYNHQVAQKSQIQQMQQYDNQLNQINIPSHFEDFESINDESERSYNFQSQSGNMNQSGQYNSNKGSTQEYEKEEEFYPSNFQNNNRREEKYYQNQNDSQRIQNKSNTQYDEEEEDEYHEELQRLNYVLPQSQDQQIDRKVTFNNKNPNSQQNHLQEQQKELENKFMNITNENEQFNEELQELQQQNETLTFNNENLCKQIEDLQQELEQKISTLQNENQQLNQTIQKLTLQNQTLTLNNDHLNEQQKHQEEQIKKWEQKYNSLQSDNQQLNDTIQKLTLEKQNLTINNQHQIEQKQIQEEQQKQWEQRWNNLQSDNQKLNQTIQILASQNQTLSINNLNQNDQQKLQMEQQKQYELNLNSLQNEITKLNETIQQLKLQNQIHDSELASTKQQLEFSNQEKQLIQIQETSKVSSHTETLNSINKQSENAQYMLSQIKTLSSHNNELTNQVKQQQNTLFEYQTTLNEQEKSIEELSFKITKKDLEIQSKQKEIEILKNQNDQKIKSSNDHKDQELDNIKNHYETKIQDLQNQINKLNNEKNTLTTKFQEKQQEYQDKISNLSTQLEDANHLIESFDRFKQLYEDSGNHTEELEKAHQQIRIMDKNEQLHFEEKKILKEELDELKKKTERNELQISQANQRKIDIIETERNNAIEERDLAIKEKNSLKNKIELLQQKLQNSQISISIPEIKDDQEEKYVDIQKQLKQVQNKFDLTKSDLDKYHMENSQQINTINYYKQQLALLEQEKYEEILKLEQKLLDTKEDLCYAMNGILGCMSNDDYDEVESCFSFKEQYTKYY